MKLILLLVTLPFGVSHKEGTISRLTRSDDNSMTALEVVVQQHEAQIQQQAAQIQQQAAQIQQQATQIQHQAAQIQQQAAQIQQQATNVETLQAKLTAFENRVSSVSTTVAFTVRFSKDNGDNGIALGSHQILKFDDVVTNIGRGYNAQTGIFTAPVSGVYTVSTCPSCQQMHIKANTLLLSRMDQYLMLRTLKARLMLLIRAPLKSAHTCNQVSRSGPEMSIVVMLSEGAGIQFSQAI